MKKILITPLNWGLGHATRCVPIIKQLLQQGAAVSIASDGGALRLLKMEFPQLAFFELPGYNIYYGRGDSMLFKMIGNYPRIKKAIAEEHEALIEIQNQNKFDVIISDNRYGMWHAETHNIFISHQINIQVPNHLKWMQPLLLNYNLKQISNFQECWIPDTAGAINLSGELSHQCKLPTNSYYIGSLSRFANYETDNQNLHNDSANQHSLLINQNFKLLIVLSGPEPQRSLFESIILKQLDSVQQKTLIVQGLTEKYEEQQLTEHVFKVSYLTTEALFQKINEADLIISRSGYSTLMDLVACGKKAVLVPTPGQTEQEYLADNFLKKQIYYSVKQNDFNLIEAIEKSKSFKGLQSKSDLGLLHDRITKLMHQ